MKFWIEFYAWKYYRNDIFIFRKLHAFRTQTMEQAWLTDFDTTFTNLCKTATTILRSTAVEVQPLYFTQHFTT